ncbi:MAG: 7TM diverse intracellular signaling domain-containing protein [Oligoflexales bacterium]
MVYGFLIVLIFYNAFLYLTYRDKSFLIYVFYIFFSLLSNSGLQGWWKPFLSSANEYFMIATCLYTFFGNYFTVTFLELKSRINKLYLANMIVQALFIVNIAISLFNYAAGALLYLLLANISAILMLFSGIISSKNGFRPAYWFTFARCVMMAFSIPYLLSLLEIVPLKAVTIWGGLTGIALETVLISFALGDKMRYIQQRDEQKIKALNATLEQKVTERTQQLAKRNNDLSSAVKENKSLIRILCHDLNNTLFIIKHASHIILNKISSLSKEKHIDLCKKIERAAATQEDIIEHVRSMELISSGKTDLQLVPTSINKVVENGKFIFNEQLKEKNLTLNFFSEFDSDVLVLADPVSLSNNVFNNLLSNSIKFSLPGKTIDIRVEKLKENRIQMTIRDYGIGMPDHIKENIFLPEKQTSRSGTSGEQGTGFGMSLVKTYVGYYQGSINLESYEQSSHPHDHGTKYILVFKMAACEQAA